MARTITFQKAISEALDQEMGNDDSVVLMGEDIVGGFGADGEIDAWGGPLGVTKGLYAKYPAIITSRATAPVAWLPLVRPH